MSAAAAATSHSRKRGTTLGSAKATAATAKRHQTFATKSSVVDSTTTTTPTPNTFLEAEAIDGSTLSAARREALIRQPSYCKILDDLQDTEERIANMKKELTDDSSQASSTTSAQSSPVHTININGTEYKVLSSSSHIGTETLQALSSTQLPPGDVLQYAASSQNGQTVFIPGTVTHTAAATNAHILSVRSSRSTTASDSSPTPLVTRSSDDSLRKREIRLMKNREAARECRNKKKEYIKCLENRVAVLENQNKALIEELKSLKEYYQVP